MEILISRKYDKLFVFLVYFLILPVTIAKDKTVDFFEFGVPHWREGERLLPNDNDTNRQRRDS